MNALAQAFANSRVVQTLRTAKGEPPLAGMGKHFRAMLNVISGTITTMATFRLSKVR